MRLSKIGLIASMLALLVLGCTNKVPEKHIQPDTDPGIVSKEIEDPTQASSSKTVYHFGPSVSVLEGTLHQVTFYGPPGYGADPEHDSQEKGFVLNLRKPIDVEDDLKAPPTNEPSLSIVGVTEIQVITTDPKIAKYKGLRMRITGVLSRDAQDKFNMPVAIRAERFQEL